MNVLPHSSRRPNATVNHKTVVRTVADLVEDVLYVLAVATDGFRDAPHLAFAVWLPDHE